MSTHSSSSSLEDLDWGPSDPDPIGDKYFDLVKTRLKKTKFKWREVGQCCSGNDPYHAIIGIYNKVTHKEYNFESVKTFVENDEMAKEAAYLDAYQMMMNFLGLKA